MQQINAGLLQAVDRFSRRIAFLSIVIDRMVDRILPKTAALAVNCYLSVNIVKTPQEFLQVLT